MCCLIIHDAKSGIMEMSKLENDICFGIMRRRSAAIRTKKEREQRLNKFSGITGFSRKHAIKALSTKHPPQEG